MDIWGWRPDTRPFTSCLKKLIGFTGRICSTPTPYGVLPMPQNLPDDANPRGLKLRHTLLGHSGSIGKIAWSPDGRSLASSSTDGTIQLWDSMAGGASRTLG